MKNNLREAAIDSFNFSPPLKEENSNSFLYHPLCSSLCHPPRELSLIEGQALWFCTFGCFSHTSSHSPLLQFSLKFLSLPLCLKVSPLVVFQSQFSSIIFPFSFLDLISPCAISVVILQTKKNRVALTCTAHSFNIPLKKKIKHDHDTQMQSQKHNAHIVAEV